MDLRTREGPEGSNGGCSASAVVTTGIFNFLSRFTVAIRAGIVNRISAHVISGHRQKIPSAALCGRGRTGARPAPRQLANAIAQKRIAHAYLFCGPRGTGKTTIARIFAKALNCTSGPKIDFDDSDPQVREITEGRSLDVLEIDEANNNGAGPGP